MIFNQAGYERKNIAYDCGRIRATDNWAGARD